MKHYFKNWLEGLELVRQVETQIQEALSNPNLSRNQLRDYLVIIGRILNITFPGEGK